MTTEITLEQAPPKARALHEKGEQARARNDLDYAMDLYEAALVIEPRLLTTRMALRQVQTRSKGRERDRGRSSLATMLKLMKTKGLLKRDPQAALMETEKLLRLSPFNKRIIRAHIKAAEAAGMPFIALHGVALLQRCRPRDVALLKTLARLHDNAENLEELYECLSALSKIEPTNSVTNNELKDVAARLALRRTTWNAEPS